MLYQVVHSTLGRCRIRVPRLADDLEFAQTLNGLLESLQFVTEVRINPAASSLIVSYKVGALKNGNVQEHFLTCIERASYIQEANLIEVSPKSEPSEVDLIPEVNQWKDLGLPLLSLSLAVFAVPLELPPLLVGLAIACAAMPWFNRAADSMINHHHPNIDLLDSVWMTLQTLQGQYVAPALKTSLVEIRRTLRGTIVQTREQEASEILSYLTLDVWVERNGFEQVIPARDLHPGDRITVHPGELIPVDGEIISGTGFVNCCHLTGVTTPVSCSQGQEVYASSVLVEGELSVLVKRTGDNTRIYPIADLIQSAPVHNTQIGAHQAEFVKNAIFPTLVLGGTIFAVTGNLGAAISPFQFDFGSGIPISISTTILCALTHAARNGVYIKSGRALELLAQMDTIVLDYSVLSPVNLGAIATLQKEGITIYLINGDSLAETIALAQQLGIHSDHILPEAQHQANLVRGLQNQGRIVAVVEDKSDCGDISVSLASVGYISEKKADVVLLNHQLRFLIYGKAIAKRAMEVLYQNTATIVVPNLMMQIGGGMILGVNPVFNVIVNNGSAFIAEFLNNPRSIFDSVTLPPEEDSSSKNAKPDILLIPPGSTDLSFPILNGKKPQAEQLIETVIPVSHTTITDWTVKSESADITQSTSNKLLKSEQDLSQLTESCHPPTLKQNELAKRLGITSQALTQYRFKPEFSEWSKAKDPHGIAWTYEAVSKSFHPQLPLSEPDQRESPEQAMRVKTEEVLGCVAGETFGEVIGGIAGETVGGLLGGPIGMLVGEEIGTVVGGILGEKLGQEIVDEVEHVHPQEPEIKQEVEVLTCETAGGKIGETVGQIVGDILLGEEGKAIGEEIGEKIGSTVGEVFGEEATAEAESGDPK
jgi:cation transport ATPase